MIVVELKAVEKMMPLYNAQLLSYLKLTGKPKGLLFNFHCDNIRNEMNSLVTNVYALLPEE
jgi:GxxExxY protein